MLTIRVWENGLDKYNGLGEPDEDHTDSAAVTRLLTLFIHPSIHSFTYLFSHSFIHSLTHLCVCVPVHARVCMLVQMCLCECAYVHIRAVCV